MEADTQSKSKHSPHPLIVAPREHWLGRCVGIYFGLGTQLLFAWTVWHLFFFLRDGVPRERTYSPVCDALLALQFSVSHSLLLWPAVSGRIKRWLPAAFYGNLFCVATCVSLLLVFRFWSAADDGLWRFNGWGRYVMLGGFFASWVALFYSLSLTGLGYQTGWTQWWHWFRRRPQPRRTFQPRGAYRWMRHPIYLSFLGLIWFTPNMTWDHVILTTMWTVYIFAGSYAKDLRLEYFLGEMYRAYETRVPGYPLIGIGPWGRRHLASAAPLEDSGAHVDTARKAA